MNTLQIITRISLLLASTLGLTCLYGAGSDTNGVTADIPVVNEISVTGVVTITVPTPVAGAKTGGSGTVASSTTTLRLTTNQTGKKVMVSRDGTFGTGVTLGVKLGANTSGLSVTELTSITTTPTALLTNINNLSTNEHDASGIPLIYTLYLTEAAAPATLTPVVTYTITD